MKDLKVLVIDPDFDYLQLISQFLATDGFHVVTATDGEEGLRKAMIESPDLILIEPMLSKLHGFTLCNIVSKEFKKKVPVIILTNHYQEIRFKKEAIQVYGAAAYLTRPVMKKELRTTIFNVLGKKSMEGVEEKPIPQVPDVKETLKEEPTENIPAEVVSEQASEVVMEGAQVVEAEAPSENVAEDTQEIHVEHPQEVVEEETVEVTANPVETPTKSSGNNGNGSNGKSKVDKMLNDIESEFGLLTDKKLANRNQDLQI